MGGTRTLALTSMAIHGGRAGDQRVMVDGLVIRNVGSNGSLTNLFPDMSSTQEITVDYGAVSAETMSGGIRVNYIPQQGGNTLSGRFFGTFVNNDFQADNFSPELRRQACASRTRSSKSYDINPSVGGAIVKDKVWFYGAARFQENNFYLAGNYDNRNAGDPDEVDSTTPISTVQAVDWITQQAGNGRVTWQATQKHRLNFHYEQQSRDIWRQRRSSRPESTGNFMFPKNNFSRPAGRRPSRAGSCWRCAARTAPRRSWWHAPARRPSGGEWRPGEGPRSTA